MVINGYDIEIFGAEVMNFSPSITESYQEVLNPYNTYGIINLGTIKSNKKISVDFLVEGSDLFDRLNKISSLKQELLYGVLKLDVDDVYEFECSLDSDKITKIVEVSNKSYSQYSVELNAVQRGSKVTINLTELVNDVDITTQSDTDAIFEITPTTTLASFTINDITISNLIALETVIIDGKAKTITVNSENKFSDCNIISFPILKSGINEITLSDLSVNVDVSYYPLYL